MPEMNSVPTHSKPIGQCPGPASSSDAIMENSSSDFPKIAIAIYNEDYLSGVKTRQEEWTHCIPVGIKSFVENVKTLLGFGERGRDVIEGRKRYQLREEAGHYKAFSGVENGDIGPENHYLWDNNAE